MKARRDPDWFAHLQVGDVLERRGAYRIVREVSRRPDGRLLAVTFAIKRRSWTNRAYTVYHATDLKQLGFRYIGARVRLTSELDRLLAAAIAAEAKQPYVLTAPDVVGVVAA